ncbi:response regulator [Hahella ganghwensis]|uniref:response regulator n=1 Tax=Hahella ganghwensis TaxID=286420 RepID=UPI0003715A56|nr:response regulator [Hahella ganghwensis]
MTKLTVVIAEDDPQNAEIQRRFLERLPEFEVVGIAHQLDQAKDLVEVMKPNLMLLDVHFPSGNGLEFLRELRAGNQATDVILITASKEATAVQEALRGGVFDYILKPLVFERLKEALDRYSEHHRKILGLSNVQQEDVDHLLPRSSGVSKPQRLPKGIDQLTLKKVREVFESSPKSSFSAEHVGAEVGASRTTARRYLEYLVSTNELQADVVYGTVGRPERMYSLVS